MMMQRPRPSSLPRLDDGSPNPEWLITEDGHPFGVGDRLFNYYDCKWGRVASEPDSYNGWFNFVHEDGTSASLNSVRVSKHEPRR